MKKGKTMINTSSELSYQMYEYNKFYVEDISKIETEQANRTYIAIVDENEQIIKVENIYLDANLSREKIKETIHEKLNLTHLIKGQRLIIYSIPQNKENKKALKKIAYIWIELKDKLKTEKFRTGFIGLIFNTYEKFELFIKNNPKTLIVLIGLLYTSFFIFLIVNNLKIPLQALLVSPTELFMLIGLLFGSSIAMFGLLLALSMLMFSFIPNIVYFFDFISRHMTAYYRDKDYNKEKINFKYTWKISQRDILDPIKMILVSSYIVLALVLIKQPIFFIMKNLIPNSTFEKNTSISYLLIGSYHDVTGFPKAYLKNDKVFLDLGHDNTYAYTYELSGLNIYDELENEKANKLCIDINKAKTKFKKTYLILRDIEKFNTNNFSTLPKKGPMHWISMEDKRYTDFLRDACVNKSFK